MKPSDQIRKRVYEIQKKSKDGYFDAYPGMRIVMRVSPTEIALLEQLDLIQEETEKKMDYLNNQIYNLGEQIEVLEANQCTHG